MMEIELLRSNLHLTIRGIAQVLETSPTNVRYWLKKHGLSVNRSPGRQRTTLPDIGETKQCTLCKDYKPHSEYYAHSKSGRLHSYCKACMCDNTVERQRAFKAQCVAYKGGQCELCGYDRYQGSFDFHHLDPTQKDFNIAKVKLHSFSDAIRQELDKCALLCANCHREVHGGVAEVGGLGGTRTHDGVISSEA